MRSEQDTIDVKCTIMCESDAAILVRVHGALPPGEDEIWFPFSQVTEIHRDPRGVDDRLTVTKWIAQKKGLI